jgi:hypothetical protein
MNQEKINELISYPISNIDLQNFLKKTSGNKTNIITYPNLAQVNDIDDIFDKLGRCVLFFYISENFGHWCCLKKVGNVITFFDPYGIKYDGEKKWISKQNLIKLHEDKPLLTTLLNNSRKKGYKIHYNNYDFQDDNNHNATCGKWTSVYLENYLMNDDQFKKHVQNLMKKYNTNSDDVAICLYFYSVLGK